MELSRDAIAALFARRQEAWDRHDAAALAADHLANGRVESPLAGREVEGRDAIARLYSTYFHAFGDLKVVQEDFLVDGNHVALVGRLTGTDTGGFMGMAPSGRAVSVPIVFVYELRDGLIARERRIYDFTGVLVQVGLIKAKPANA